MALGRVKTWVAGDVLTAADQNAEFNNLLNNPISLISPTTGAINFNLQAHTNFVAQGLTSDPAVATTGRLYLNTATKQMSVDDGTIIRVMPTVSATASLPGSLITVSSSEAQKYQILGMGTSGQVLVVTSSAMAPAWGTVASVIVTSSSVKTATTLTASQLVVGAGTNIIDVLGSLGTTAQSLRGNAGGAPTWATAPLGSGVKGNSVYWSDANTVANDTGWFNVRAYGAVGDGTTDDTTAINSAVTAALAASHGAVVYFPPGRYRTSTGITVAMGAGGHPDGVGGVTIQGAGVGSSELLGDAGVTTLKILGEDRKS